MSTIKLKAKAKGDAVSVKALIKHPMETGLRKDKEGNKIPAKFINKVTVSANDKVVMVADWGPAVAKNPYMGFSYKGKSGDKIKLSWTDNSGKSDELETEAK